MDNCSTPKPSSSESDTFTRRFRVLNLLDPRSPTTAFQRTPLQMIALDTPDSSKTDNLTGSESVGKQSTVEHQDDCDFTTADNTMYESFDSRVEVDAAPSPPKKFLSNSTNDIDSITKETKSEPNIRNSNKLSNPATRIQTDSTPTTPVTRVWSRDVFSDGVENDSFEKIPSKQLFYTPNKKRTPLLAVDNVCASTPPTRLGLAQNFNQSQWKRFQEERKKLGFDLDENVQLPLNDITASAPSKLPTRRIKIRGQIDNV